MQIIYVKTVLGFYKFERVDGWRIEEKKIRRKLLRKILKKKFAGGRLTSVFVYFRN